MWIRRLAVVAVVALSVSACDQEPTGPDARVLGSTPGWFNGNVVQFDYTQDFFCRQPPASNAPSGCETGEAAQTRPEMGTLPILYVITPLFSPAPAAAELHCPTVGNCIAHPSTLDVGRVLGPDARNIPLPAHSHIIEDRAGGQPTWFEVRVVGVTDQGAWTQITAARNLARVRQLQAAGQGITPDLPSNLFLRFSVR